MKQFFLLIILLLFSGLVKAQQVPMNWDHVQFNRTLFRDYISQQNCYMNLKHFYGCSFALNTLANDRNKSLQVVKNKKSKSWEFKIFERHEKKTGLALSLFKKSTYESVLNNMYSQFPRYDVNDALVELTYLDDKEPSSFELVRAYNSYIGHVNDFYSYISTRHSVNTYTVPVEIERNSGRVWINHVPAFSMLHLQGAKKGDEIISINGKKIHEMNSDQFYRQWHQSFSSVVSMIVKKKSKEKLIYIATKQRSYLQKRVTGNQKYIRPFGITNDTYSKIRKSLTEPNDAQTYILDLRNNSGGSLEVAVKVAGLFSSKKLNVLLFPFKENAKMRKIKLNTVESFSRNLVILINARTISSAEALAGLLAVNPKALVLGERSYGKGAFQEWESVDVSQRLMRWRSIGFYHLPFWGRVQARGISPDIVIEEIGQKQKTRAEDYYFIQKDNLEPVTHVYNSTYSLRRSFTRRDLIQCFKTAKKSRGWPSGIRADSVLVQALAGKNCFEIRK